MVMHISPEALESIAKVQTLRALREAKHHWRAHYRSMPAAGDRCVAPSLHSTSAAGSLSIQGEIA